MAQSPSRYPRDKENSLSELIRGEMSELAEGARLEIVCAVKSGTEGSNPSFSANNFPLLGAYSPDGNF